MPTSKTIVDFLGRTIVQHFDDTNRLLGTSFRCPSTTGHNRWEHYDDLSRCLGVTDAAEGFFGNYRAHSAALGPTTAEAREKGGLVRQWRRWLAQHRGSR
jgi:hypothetical protein